MKISQNSLKKELLSRKNHKEEVYSIIGAEIKDRRITLSRTLSSLSYKICSTSYLCKIENNKIVPNRIFLKEICKRLQMKEEKVDTLLNLKMTLEQMVKAFVTKKIETLEYAYSKGVGLRNYRYKVIEFIYHIAKKDLEQANLKSGELMRLSSTMADGDLIIFSLFNAILSFYNQDFKNALDDLEALDVFSRLSDEIRILQRKYKFYIYFVLNHPCCIFEYHQLVQTLLLSCYIQEIEEIHYIMGLYLLRNRYFSQYKKIFKLIHVPVYRKSLSLLAKLMLAPRLSIKPEWIEGVRPFFYYLGLLKVDFKRASLEISRLNALSFDVDFNLIYLQYLLVQGNEERFKFMMRVVFPTLERSEDGFAIDYFLCEFAKLSSEFCKYKNFNENFKKLKGVN